MKTKTISTIREIIQAGSAYLAKKGIDNARWDAEQLIAYGLGFERVDLYLNFDKPLSEAELEHLRGLFKLRAAGKPLQYITGRVHFRYLKLDVNENVLIPRMETELIIDICKNLINSKARVLELGTGSGAIALSVAKESNVKVDAVDVSKEALEVASANANLNRIKTVNFSHSDWFSEVKGSYDLIVANPPYVSKTDFDILPVEIRLHEPAVAITDDNDGLSCLRTIIDQAPQFLNQKGYLVLEIGYDQQQAVEKLLNKASYKNISFEKDFAGKVRFAISQSPD